MTTTTATSTMSAEKKVIKFITECYAGIKEYKTQYRMAGFRVDLCFLQDKIVVECDEFDHDHYNQEREVKRERIIREAGYRIIRFNPFAEDFRGTKVIRAINMIMMENDPTTIPTVKVDPIIPPICPSNDQGIKRPKCINKP